MDAQCSHWSLVASVYGVEMHIEKEHKIGFRSPTAYSDCGRSTSLLGVKDLKNLAVTRIVFEAEKSSIDHSSYIVTVCFAVYHDVLAQQPSTIQHKISKWLCCLQAATC